MNVYPLKLSPWCKEVIWGGTKLIEEYGKNFNSSHLGETWELSVRANEASVIANGEYAGMTLGEYLGNPVDFPLLVKFIDANQPLSVQVHPAKTEMWYIVDAEPGAKLVYGLTEPFSTLTVANAIGLGMLENYLNYVPVKPGDVFFIPSGLVHAIGDGILLAEIQQNNDTTYRLYDYNRRDSQGNKRELHIAHALDTICDLTPRDIADIRYKNASARTDNTLASCDFFTVNRYCIKGSLTLTHSDFLHILCIAGNGTIGGEPVTRGDSYYIPAAYGAVVVSGNMEIIVSEA